MIETNFRNTEIGLIPADWTIKAIGDIANIVNGSTPSTDHPEYYGHDYQFVSPYDLGDNKYVLEATKKLSALGLSISRQIPKGSIMYTCTGSTIGKLGIASKLMTTNQQINSILPNKSYSTDYLFYAIQTRKDDVRKRAAVQAVPLINKRNFSKTQVAFPPEETREQERIASALSDIDSLISTLEKLIEKKRNIKQGAMQELLTGNKRTSGFSKPWESIPLEEILRYEQPTPYLVNSKNYSEFGTPVLTAGKTFVLGYTSEKEGVYTDLPVIIFDDFVTESKYVDFRFKAKSSAMKMLHLRNDKHNLRFIYEIMQLILFYAPEHKRYWISRYSKIKVMVPEKEEQDAIVGILSDMDAEIIALAGKLEKYQSIKQGMMQQLLTGKIRLI